MHPYSSFRYPLLQQKDEGKIAHKAPIAVFLRYFRCTLLEYLAPYFAPPNSFQRLRESLIVYVINAL